MANKLRQVFNNNELSYKGNIQFHDYETAKEFSDALNAVFERGDTVKVSGNAAMSWGLNSGASEFPLDSFDNVTGIVVGPSVNEQILIIKVDDKDVIFKVETYYLKDGFVIRTPRDFPFEMKICFSQENNTVTLNFSPHLDKARNIENALLNIKQLQGLIKKLFNQDNNIDSGLRALTDSLDDYYDLFDQLSFIEQIFNIHFDINDIDLKDEESHKDLYELCLVLRENKALRINAKMNSSDGKAINFESGVEVEKDEPLVLIFLNDVTYKIWGQTMTLYCAFFVGNALTKDIINLDNGNIRVIYGEKETNPMYMAYKGFLTEDDAREELKDLMNHKEEYESAKTVEQYAAEQKIPSNV